MNEFEAKVLKKLSGLTTNQQESLLSFLDEPAAHTKSSVDDIIVSASFLKDLRNTRAYKNSRKRGSAERALYLKYVKEQEKEIELEIYYHIRQMGGQLRKGGYSNALLGSELNTLNPEEQEIYDSVFPENKFGTDGVVVSHPDMSIQELEAHDIASTAKYKSMRVELPEGPKAPAHDRIRPNHRSAEAGHPGFIAVTPGDSRRWKMSEEGLSDIKAEVEKILAENSSDLKE